MTLKYPTNYIAITQYFSVTYQIPIWFLKPNTQTHHLSIIY